jgi:pimeloyl-ACP methyl ester carboxylesterase
MCDAMLAAYRSAAYLGDWELGAHGPTPPGLIVWGSQDPYQDAAFGRRAAERTGAELVVLEGCGHWWQIERPAEVAGALRAFWERVAASLQATAR